VVANHLQPALTSPKQLYVHQPLRRTLLRLCTHPILHHQAKPLFHPLSSGLDAKTHTASMPTERREVLVHGQGVRDVQAREVGSAQEVSERVEEEMELLGSR
jgi:hypothetical protein